MVGERKTRGTIQDGPDDLMDLGTMLIRLKRRERVAVERWIRHAEMGERVPMRRWMQVEVWQPEYDVEQGTNTVRLNRAWKIASWYARHRQHRKAGNGVVKQYKDDLESGMRKMSLRYGKRLYEVTV